MWVPMTSGFCNPFSRFEFSARHAEPGLLLHHYLVYSEVTNALHLEDKKSFVANGSNPENDEKR